MAFRRPAALPTLALAAALGATALATTAAAEHTASHSAGSHSASGYPHAYGNVKDWNSMVPEGGHPAEAAS
ncbi:hypothetical protein KGQ20_19550 [Catenulispora sp. NF23]|uniref:Uncharacterized protein n=1 Tax=Catenulispora pinistramenti TaxID=2705254 RepID=A0ABS5KVE7_9ACTN|nr:hypothetical protein [Catenulispora pinistramenti]MBS2534967.1 hypothetical protein [Catenulispora pinistramenti]MBS2550032.1 hypothetical protein [Catenulispora pinistramenti]